MTDPMAIVRLYDAEKAPAYRDSLATRSHFTVEDFGADTVGVFPVEGAGAVAEHFKLVRLADASSDLDDPALLAPLGEHAPRLRADVDADAYLEAMNEAAARIQRDVAGLHADLAALAVTAFGAAQNGNLDELVRAQLPFLFRTFPRGSLWYVEVSDVLYARLAFGRSQLAMSLLDDLPVGEDMDRLPSMEGLTLTKGADMSAAINVASLLLSPATLSFQIPAIPHTVVFCFGAGVELRHPYPISLASLYRPRVLDNPEGLHQFDFVQSADPADGEQLLAWWIDRLNHVYSHACDPTCFTDAAGLYDAPAQSAWLITVERLLGDLTSLLAEPQATDLDRIQIAFDLLDKAESLLGYGRRRSGKGFAALLRRTRCAQMLRAAFASMPPAIAQRYETEAARLFDEIYAKVRANAVSYRREPSGVRVGDRDARLVTLDDETYVSRIVRAVRNSSHGLLEILRDHEDRHLLATNTGAIPVEFPALAALIGIALISDIEGLIDGSTRARLTGA